MFDERELKRMTHLRWGVFTVVLIGIAASVAMNAMHAPANLWAVRVVAGLPPLAVFACLEVIIRIPSSSRWLSAVRIFGAVLVGSGATALSYAQQKAAVLSMGFPEWQSWIWPAIIDGVMIVMTVSLVEVVRVLRRLEAKRAEADGDVKATVNAIAEALPVPVSPAAPVVFQPPVEPRKRERQPAGRGGPQVMGPSRPGLDGKTPLLAEPPQV